MEQQSKTQLICEAAGIPQEQQVKTNISEDILDQSTENLDKLNLSPDDQYLVNLTGGTKMMAIAVWRYFRQFPHVRNFYIPINKGVYHELFEKEPSKTAEFNYQISVAEYLKIYGIRFEHEKILFTEKDAFDIFKDVKAGRFDLEKFPKRRLRKLNMQDTVKQTHTKWFEEYVYYLLKQELKLRDDQIVTGVKLFAINEEKKQEQYYGNDNEVDVLFIYRNRPYLIECKFSIGRENINTHVLHEHIYKLAAINRRFGLSAQAAIFTLSDLSGLSNNARNGIERRLSITGVRKIIDQKYFAGNFSRALQEF